MLRQPHKTASFFTLLTYRLFITLSIFQSVGLRYGVVADAVAPIVLESSGVWDGNDGPWSTFNFRIGSPRQVVRLLPSFELSYIVTVGLAGCPDSIPISNCSGQRGNLFISGNSKTWLGSAAKNTSAGQSALDGIGPNGSDSITIGTQIAPIPIKGQALKISSGWSDFIGAFGLSGDMRNRQNGNGPFPNLLKSVLTAANIPTNTWSYTAGNFNDGELASLVLGGYDASRFHNTSSMHLDSSATAASRFIVNITSFSVIEKSYPSEVIPISSTYTTVNVKAVIDVSTPFLWLPQAMCETIAKKLQLQWNPAAQLYTISDVLHTSLLERNASLMMVLGNAVNQNGFSARSTGVYTIRYSSLYLNASYPLFNGSSTRYFPIRPGLYPSTGTYALGRSFLQDTHLIADFDRSSFTLSQSQYSSEAPPQIVGITREASTTRTSSPPYIPESRGLNLASILVITLALTLLAVVFFVAYGFWAYNKGKPPFRRAARDRKEDDSSLPTKAELDTSMESTATRGLARMATDEIQEAESTPSPVEIEGKGWDDFFEMQCDAAVYELDVRPAARIRESRVVTLNV